MGFRVSPGVSITEKDLTTIVPAVATTPGGFAGNFHWGPADEIVNVTNEKELVSIFTKPTTANYVDFFTAANFLGYGNRLGVVRVVGAAASNSSVKITGASYGTTFQIKNSQDFSISTMATTTLPTAGVVFAGKYPGVLGNSIKCVITSGSGIASGFTLASAVGLGGATMGVSASATMSFSVGDSIVFADGTEVSLTSVPGNTSTNLDFFGITHTAAAGITIGIDRLGAAQASGTTFTIRSAYAKQISTTATTTQFVADAGGSGDLVNVLVLDKDGLWTGTANSVLEKYEGLSRTTTAVNFDGSSNYWKTVINEKSRYVWALSADVNGSNTATDATATFVGITGGSRSTTTLHGQIASLPLIGASGGAAPSDSERYQNGWAKFADSDAVDVALIPTGDASAALAALIIQNVCEPRKDCMAFVSPASTDVVNKLPHAALNSLKTFRDTTLNINSSYAVADSGWKLQLDTYNNTIRTMPLNPDIAGLVARTEFTNEAWFSPAGFNRGQIKNVISLAYNPSSEGHRDELYTRQINPVVSFSGEGTILFGDKTMQTRPSAFDRINVRRLFIILEKSIATASKYFLFEQNDTFTRLQFKNIIVPFLKTVQQRRGITDFLVVCDDTNNTGEVIDRNEFVADIFIKPTRTVNFMQLNFVATKTGVSFSEVPGA